MPFTLTVRPLLVLSCCEKALLCLLSFVTERKEVPVRHEHKGEIIEEVISKKKKPTVKQLN